MANGYGVGQYRTKLNHIAKVIACVNGFELPDIVGLCEVENDTVLSDLCRQFSTHPYSFVHYDSPDRRGIDVALLYQPKKWNIVCSRPVPVYLDSTTTTRDLLYVCMASISTEKDTLHLILCHLPSQLGGRAESEWKREKGRQVIMSVVDSVQKINQEAKILVLGDFNSNEHKLPRLKYLEPSYANHNVQGTHKYQGRWSNLDQVYCSSSLDGKTNCSIFAEDFMLEEDKKYGGVKPYRTNVFYGARSGYADHLPLVVHL